MTTFNWRSTPKQQLLRPHVPLDSSGVTSRIAANRSGQQHTSPWSIQKWSMILHPGIHTRQKMPTTLTKSSAGLRAMLATTTRSGPKDVSQQWLTHKAGKHFKTAGKCNVLTMLFKIKHNLVEIPEAESIVWSKDSRTRGSQRLFVPYTSVTVYNMSFFPRTIQDWNKLPSSITDMQDIEAFKTALHARKAVQPPSTA